MALRGYPLRILLTTALTSLLLLTLGASVAWLLYRQQSAKGLELEENIGSRRAAVVLEGTLTELISAHRQGEGDVVALQEKVQEELEDIHRLADKDPEHIFWERLDESFQSYLRLWKRNPSPARNERLVETLQEKALPACRSLRDYNAHQIEESGLIPQQALFWMAWGLAAVGGLGSLAGLLLGYGLARGLSQTIHQLRIQVRDASSGRFAGPSASPRLVS
jgi:two-component system sensor histidine kinase HydH